MKRLPHLLFLLLSYKTSAQDYKLIHITRPALIYSQPTLENQFVIDTLLENTVCYASSLITINTKYGPADFWHISTSLKWVYIQDSPINIDYDDSDKQLFREWVLNSKGDSVRMKLIEDHLNNALKDQNNLAIDTLDYALLSRQIKAKVGIDYFVYWYPKYSEAVDLEFAVKNYNKAPIKYITVYIGALDAVGGSLLSMDRQKVVKLKCVGPVRSCERGVYQFGHAFWSPVIDSIYISKLEVEYMSGEKKTMITPNSLIGRHEMTKDLSDYLH